MSIFLHIQTVKRAEPDKSARPEREACRTRRICTPGAQSVQKSKLFFSNYTYSNIHHFQFL